MGISYSLVPLYSCTGFFTELLISLKLVKKFSAGFTDGEYKLSVGLESKNRYEGVEGVDAEGIGVGNGLINEVSGGAGDSNGAVVVVELGGVDPVPVEADGVVGRVFVDCAKVVEGCELLLEFSGFEVGLAS